MRPERGRSLFAKYCRRPTGYEDGSSDWAVPDAGRVYAWSWDNLKRLLS